MEKNPGFYWQEHWKNIHYRINNSGKGNGNSNKRGNIYVTELVNLVTYLEEIVFIVHCDLPDSSKIYTIAR